MKVLLKKTTNSSQETIEFGKEILKQIPNDINLIFLNGGVGAGKTTFVKGLAKALSITDEITSPTYGYKNVYDGLVHYDLFLSKKMKAKEILSLISEDLENNIVVIEWGDKIPKTSSSVAINIESKSEFERIITVKI